MPEDGQPLSSGTFPTYTLKAGTNVPLSLLAFGKGSSIFWKFYSATYGASKPNITVKIEWESDTGAVSGSVVWGAQIVAVVPGGATNTETMSMAAQLTVSSVVNGNAHGLNESIITLTGASLNNLVANSMVWIQIQRVSAGDTMAGNANLLLVVLNWPSV